ncbi:EAL domain-containing protein [Candidatus Pristimantibacillus sp. PTI5]|uniref:sensor domain-containing protein n=1 Tax=Candidatus Pristimantibacillus sp. PTI5 TaxID=3400422 RepID=UPI003B02449C
MKHFPEENLFDKNRLRNLISEFTGINRDCETDHPFYQTMFKSLIENAPVGMYLLENETFLYVNSFFANLLGYETELLMNEEFPLNKIFHPQDFPVIQKNIETRSAGLETETRYPIRMVCKDGSILFTEVHASTARIYGKSFLIGSVIDITEQALAKQQLEESNQKYKSIFENSPDAIYSFDDTGKFISANPACELITGYMVDELLEMSFMPLIVEDDLPAAVRHFEEAKQGSSVSVDLRIVKKDGDIIHLNSSHFPMTVNGRIIGTYGIARDITHKILYEQQMQKLAFYDTLTNLPNRKLFQDRVEQLINLSSEGNHPFAVMFLDLDRFKFINDSLGHQLGDKFLKLISERFTQHLRKSDTVSRLAGDEFTFLFPETSLEEAVRLAQQINRILLEPFDIEGNSVTIKASIGIALSMGNNDSSVELMRKADTAMYHTKKFKKNGYSIYSEEMDVKAAFKLEIERDLKFAISNEELELYYQPILDIKTREIIAMEALIRWHHPKLGLVSPVDFIPIAEESGQIIAIGTWVMETACRQIKIWHEQGISPFKVAVNISTKQLLQDHFVDTVIQTLEKADLAPQWLELEVTESVLLDDIDSIQETLLKLKESGISVSIDDFGTGFTSLSYLRNYPFDKVKIDRCFIDDINRDMNGKRITSAIISLAQTLNMKVVAEGIENELQLAYLEKENCSEGQGYYFSRPLPVSSIEIKFKNRGGKLYIE